MRVFFWGDPHPVGIYTDTKMKKICFDTKYIRDVHLFYKEYCLKPDTMLLESAEIVAKTGVKSLAGVRCALKICCDDLRVTVKALNANGRDLLCLLAKELKVPSSKDSLFVSYERPQSGLDENTRLKAPGPLDVMRAVRKLTASCDGIMISGNISFDFINNFEYIGDVPKGENPCSDYTFFVFDLSLTSNHIDKTTTVNAFSFGKDNYEDTALEALRLRDRINDFAGVDCLNIDKRCAVEFHPDLNDDEFAAMVNKIKEHIRCGDAFQVVPSRTFSAQCPDPFLAYEYLKKLNPSPYMYYICDPNFVIFGASPEFAVRYVAQDNTVSISPIAGTRTRGIDKNGQLDRELDSRIELELRTDKKEVSEHLMLVDLARNDLARIAKTGTRYVDNMLHVDKYQAVMHLVSDVHAKLRDDLDAFNAYQACMNMGTLSGAPKIKAHELIYRYEGKKRGSYGGVVAIIGNDGSFDSCITIRSAFVKDGKAYVQAGCGVVYDSDPKSECQETVNKARSTLTAIYMALDTLNKR